MADENKVQERYMEYQLLVQQYQQLQQNIQTLEKHVYDMNNLKENLDTISKTQINKETLIPLGSGIFLKGELKDNKNVIMNVGSDVFVEKNVEEAIKTVDKQFNEVNNLLEQMQEEIVRTHLKINEMQEEFKELREQKLEE